MSLIKIFGLCLIFFSCSFFGFYKSNLLVKRTRKLNELCISLEKLCSLLKFGTNELDSIIPKAFKDEMLYNSEKGLIFDKSYLLKEDSEILERFIKDIGMGDLETELNRISLYKSLLEKQGSGAEEDYKRLFKLYNSVGVLSGLAICIFLV